MLWGYDQELDEWHEIRDQEGQVRFEPRLVRRKELQVSHATQMSSIYARGAEESRLGRRCECVCPDPVGLSRLATDSGTTGRHTAPWDFVPP